MLDRVNNLLKYSRTFKKAALTMLLSDLVYENIGIYELNDDIKDDIKQLSKMGTDYDDLDFWFTARGSLTEIAFDKETILEGEVYYTNGEWYHIQYNGKSNSISIEKVIL